MKKIPLKLPSGGYGIYISSGKDTNWLKPLKGWLHGREPLVITSSQVARYCLPPLKKSLRKLGLSCRLLLIPDGEQHKNLKTVGQAYQKMVHLGVDRQTPVLLLGGGVVGDLGGFAAATYLRGLSFVQIGTTLVAQVDSSIGGKLGVDLPEGKNLVGVFGQPQAVLSHIPYLKTLPKRELVGGLAEVIKYGVISDPNLFHRICREKKMFQHNEKLLFEIVSKSSAIKAQVVSADERESSQRMILNFGHTFGHALERLTHYKKYLHGEAIGIGMSIAARLSAHKGFCSPKEAERLIEGIQSIGLPTEAPTFSSAQWKKALEVDKKSRGGKIHFVYMKRLGQVVIVPQSARELVRLYQKIQ